MAKRAHAYPQVEPGAAALADIALVRVPRSARVEAALARARSRQAGMVVAGERAFVLRDDLARGSLLGLGALPARALARPLPVVDARSSEVAIRRLLAGGAAMVVVRDRHRPLGAVAPDPAAATDGASLGARVARELRADTRQLLGTIARVAGERGMRAFVVGGLVRDLLRGAAAEPRDLDIVIEGDAIAVARALAAAGGAGERAVTEHERFLTASVDLPGAGRVDLATARAERYETPGALPRVMPASIGQDLGRRDFTVNALALELGSDDLVVIDRVGGRRDLAARRLRVLHPLSFVEDPTRIFRCARYAARLGFAPDAWTTAAMALALNLAPYPALSGARLLAELDLIVGDARPATALGRLGRTGAFRLLDPRYRFTRATATAVGRLTAALAWAARHQLRVTSAELAVLTLLHDQERAVQQAALRRLALSGEPLVRVERALAARLVAGETAGPAPGRARELRKRSDAELAGLWLVGDDTTRAALDWYVGQARATRPALRGDDVVGLGVPAGPSVGRVLDELRDARLEGRVKDRDDEVAYVRHWIELTKEG